MVGCKIYVVLIFIVLIFWYVHVKKAYYSSIYLEELLLETNCKVKTGDLVLFKAMDNLYSTVIGSYFTHIGIIIIDDKLTGGVPFIFEAMGVRKFQLRQDKSKRGIYCTPLLERLKRFNGITYLKQLDNNILPMMHNNLLNFIYYALDNMDYEYNILQSFTRKLLGEKCSDNTNCGELVFLSLVNMDLLVEKQWLSPIKLNKLHHLRWMCTIKNLNNQYKYNDIIEIIKTPIV
jgi:hypothetical protein